MPLGASPRTSAFVSILMRRGARRRPRPRNRRHTGAARARRGAQAGPNGTTSEEDPSTPRGTTSERAFARESSAFSSSEPPEGHPHAVKRHRRWPRRASSLAGRAAATCTTAVAWAQWQPPRSSRIWVRAPGPTSRPSWQSGFPRSGYVRSSTPLVRGGSRPFSTATLAT